MRQASNHAMSLKTGSWRSAFGLGIKLCVERTCIKQDELELCVAY